MANPDHLAYMSEQHDKRLDDHDAILFGDRRLGKDTAGLVQNMARVLRTAERNAEEIQRVQQTLNDMSDTLQHLRTQSDARQREADSAMGNRISKTAAEISRTIMVILFCTPVLISDIRVAIFGDSAYMWFGALAMGVAAFATIAILTRKNGHYS